MSSSRTVPSWPVLPAGGGNPGGPAPPPLGLALANVDGRFVYLNKAFRKAAGLSKEARPAYPGDLVVDEDKTAVSDAVRRFARGPSTSSDMAIRLKNNADEPVALNIAGTRGLGEAAV